jgi:hypothetical protein
VRLVIDARETGRKIAGITSSSNPCRRARTVEPGNWNDEVLLAEYGRPVRRMALLRSGNRVGAAKSAAQETSSRSTIRSGNRAERRPSWREHRAPASMIGLGNRAEHRSQRTGAPCSEVAGVVSGNRSGEGGFMVQATRGTAVDLGVSGNRSDEIGFDTRATCAVTIARARGQPRVRGSFEDHVSKTRGPGAVGRAVPSGMERKRFHGFGDHVRGPFRLGRPAAKRASWIRETETRRPSWRRKLRDEERWRTGSRSGDRAEGRAHDLLFCSGDRMKESVDTTNSTRFARASGERGATNVWCGQPCWTSVDATKLGCGAPHRRERRENKLMAWATRR